MDAVCLDGLLAEIRPLILGRRLQRLRPAGGHAVRVEISGREHRWLWLSAARDLPGLFLLTRGETRACSDLTLGEPEGASRQALLLLGKHLEGTRVYGLSRIPGLRAVVLQLEGLDVVLSLAGPAPTLSLGRNRAELTRLGQGPQAWPPPPPAPEREWRSLPPAVIQQAAAGGARGRREVQSLCPGLGPLLASEIARDPDSFVTLAEELQRPRPTLFTPRPLASCSDRDLASAADVVLVPFPVDSLRGRGLVTISPGSWREAAALFLSARLRGINFAERRQRGLQDLAQESRRLRRLEAHLIQDLAGLASEAGLRRQGEALLAYAGTVAAGSATVRVPDPYDPATSLDIGIDSRLSLHANADRLFDKGRRMRRARRQIEDRLAATRKAAQGLAERERALGAATRLEQLEPLPVAAAGGSAKLGRPAPGGRGYLTSRGLQLLVGRAARENHRLTFAVAGPEDLWLHAQGVPGAHVILRDPEGRAGPQDLREAAELAAFFSEARRQGKVDVQVARRKHLRPVKGSPGRVLIGHAETLRVEPRDPAGRLRER